MLEKASGYVLPHGMCVAAGMAVMARACAEKGICSKEDARALLDALSRCRLPTRAPLPFEETESALMADKKRAGGQMTLALFGGIGRVYLKTMAYEDARALLYRGWLC